MSKRSAPPSTSEPASKRTTLNSFFPSTSTPSLPSPIVSSSPITDRQSTFIAHACPITHQSQAVLFQNHIRSSRSSSHPLSCDHECLGWRTMSLKVGRDGLGGEEDWTVKTGGDDDGEKGAAREIHNAIQKEAAVDVAVVVSRLYGGVMLGPVRFNHINQVATQALERLSHALSVTPLIARLTSLDREISEFTQTPNVSTKGKALAGPEYEGMPLEKLERLCLAREKRLELLKKKFRQEEEALWKEVERQEQEEPNRGERSGEELKDTGGDAPDRDEAEKDVDEAEMRERREAEEEAALWEALEAADSGGFDHETLTEDFGLPDEEDAAVAAATLSVERKKREKEENASATPAVGMGGGFLLDE